MSLSADITVGRTSLTGTTLLTVPITVSPTASLGPRSVTVTNPDGGSGSRPNTMTVVETADIDRDCKIDVGDLNILARAWNTATSESAYIAAADLDGDGYVGPIDLAIFVEYLGQMLAVCP